MMLGMGMSSGGSGSGRTATRGSKMGRMNYLAQQAQARRQQQQAASAAPTLPSGVGEGLNKLVESYNEAFTSAKEANEARYQEMLGITDRTTGQRQQDIRSDAARELASQQSGLARLGMAGTTVAPTMAAGVKRREQEALNRAADAGQQTRLGIMERRTDAYPDTGLLAGAFQSVGSGFGGAGMTAMFNAMSNLQL